MKYALIVKGFVENVVEAEQSFIDHLVQSNKIDTAVLLSDQVVSPGDAYDGENFIAAIVEDLPCDRPQKISIEDINEQVASLIADNLILMDALATTFEEILMLREELMGGGV